jgi:hypothetical protein
MQKMTQLQARNVWLNCQKLNEQDPFGKGAVAALKAIQHLGYVQIDTIHVIERCHHHILYNRIPQYDRDDIKTLQTKEKSIFEYWAHALAYIPLQDYRYYMKAMNLFKAQPSAWYKSVQSADVRKILSQIKKQGPLSIRDITDDIATEKDHAWASTKPSKKVLEFCFYAGQLVISERQGMLKKYDLTDRHFDWLKKPSMANELEMTEYLLNRSLKSQGIVSLDSICYLYAKRKKLMLELIENKVKKNHLVPVQIENIEKIKHWIRVEDLQLTQRQAKGFVHILSPFDPLIIQRKRLKLFFNYDHRFEAYLPAHKRIFGYFALPVLLGDQIVANIDLKTDRQNKKLRVQQWTWLEKHKSVRHKKYIEEELHRFEKFQLK